MYPAFAVESWPRPTFFDRSRKKLVLPFLSDCEHQPPAEVVQVERTVGHGHQLHASVPQRLQIITRSEGIVPSKSILTPRQDHLELPRRRVGNHPLELQPLLGRIAT